MSSIDAQRRDIIVALAVESSRTAVGIAKIATSAKFVGKCGIIHNKKGPCWAHCQIQCIKSEKNRGHCL